MENNFAYFVKAITFVLKFVSQTVYWGNKSTPHTINLFINMIYRYLIVLLGILASLQAEAQHFLEKSFQASFTQGVVNQVCYIQIPANVNLYGTLEIEITGGFNNQLNRGVLRKRIDIVYSQGYLNQESEITESSEPFSSYWAIGDFDQANSRIPIYHLNNIHNDINVKVKMHLLHVASIPVLQSGLSVSIPVVGTGAIPRQYRHFNDERIGIGTKSPEFKLDIVGTARAHEIRVNTQKTADFVFEPDYELPTLDSVKTFIQKNRHLPGIPSARQMEKGGINVGSLQIDLLQKVEELTLHLIRATERAELQERKIIEQENRIKELENRL